MTALYDAHVHLAAPELNREFSSILEAYEVIDLRYAVCVGTGPEDWARVQCLGQNPRILPAVGLHPWQVNDAPSNWKQRFDQCLQSGVRIIGEIGLDKWQDGYDLESQLDAFDHQFRRAVDANLPTSIHCLKATGALIDYLRSNPVPECGFKLHAFNGPIELISELCAMGAYFSFNSGQLGPRKTKTLERVRAVPMDRLLIETDAPDFLPAPDFQDYRLSDQKLCHPANLKRGYQAIAKVINCSVESLTQQVEANFLTYFRES
ncbi:TatD family hydrolase [Coraliomargarita akajimensis]|uniref:TatD-related deoxyribonuclease n=1 Tax=Coraliomargarita akajimensis (strain DSM 45221 / IAM 15411 / JCM 23193 / KCTC 12865 / 04OKA010-24) TaxID=583355 RepID=D5ENP0_CORAD|nr:TatD family hydrolase [Coraliomargarita akajimensis]ADE55516.1 TatD-related deoxyribonuclease [Coraliomargarita akajimensis DSM 45221]